MKISAINFSCPVPRKSKVTNSIKPNGVFVSNGDSFQKNYQPSFGFDPVSLAVLAGYLASMGTLVAVANYQIKRDEEKERQEQERLDKERQLKLNEISNSLGVSVKDAANYHDAFLKCADIPIKGNGQEIGLNAVMGYKIEKYKLAVDVVAPIVRAQMKWGLFSLVPNGVLLYGPSGSGKTYIADKLLEHMKYFGVKNKEINFDEDNHEQNVSNIVQAFEEAKKHFEESGEYTVIKLPEDIDNYIIDRNSENASYNLETAALIKYCENCAENGAVCLATANNPKKIDKAILRPGRTDIKLPIGNMDDYAISDMIKYSLYKYGESDIVEEFDYQKVVETMEENSYIHTPYEIETFVKAAKNHCWDPNAHICADDVIAQMVKYNDDGLLSLDEEGIIKFQDDQTYIKLLDRKHKK